MINRFSTLAAITAALTIASCSSEPRRQIDATHAVSLTELNNVLAGEWQSAQAEYETMYFLPSLTGEKDLNIVKFSTASMSYYKIDSFRVDGAVCWRMMFLYKSGDTSKIIIKRLTSDTLIIEESEGLISGLYLKKNN